jgi:ribosomal protein S18 acetylase RimI-like enzyme
MASRSDLRIVRMSDSHLREVFGLIDNENWGWEFAEIQQIHGLDPGGSVVALDGREVVGLVTCVDFGALAFIVHVIVRKGYRGKGVGVRMMENVLAGLDSRGVSSVELHANPEAVEFYNQFSFKKVEEVSYYSREPAAVDGGAGPADHVLSWLSPGDVSVISEAVSSATGYGRDDVERALSKTPPHQVLARMADNRATALLLSRTGLELNGAGPWIVENPTEVEAEGMLRALLSAVPAKRMDVLSPMSNEVASRTLGSCGFSLVKAGIVRVARTSGHASRYPESLLCLGHLGLI